MKKLTVFTPTFNRKHLIHMLYESLKRQTDKNFIWLVIDDGSTDGTEDLIHLWRAENNFEIQYFYKPNEGMHSAHNWAYERITTPWCTCIDSDDMMPDTAVASINTEIADDPGGRFYGIVGLDADFKGMILGKTIPETFTEVKMAELESLYGINGDKKLVYKTEVIKNLPPYPIFEGERLVPLSYKSLMAEQKGLVLKPVNKVWCLVEYQEDGSTMNMLKQYRRHPRGFAFMRMAKLNSDLHFKEKVKSAVHLVSAIMFTGEVENLFRTKHTGLVLASIPAGILLNLHIRIKTKKNS